VNLKHIQDKGGIKKLFQVELSEKMLRRDEKDDAKYEIKPIRVVGDEEFVPFKAKSLDLIFSNLSLHWVNDLPGTLIQIRHTLKEDGLFLAAMLGENTLIELRNAFYLAEQEREGGLSPHVSPFAGVADMGNLLTRAGFALPTVDTESFTIRYKDPWVLFSDLRAMGESNATLKRRLSTPPSTLMAAAAAYQAMYGAADGSIPATFQVR
jgi:NADH dehydrogenase [ubiquinone] 1 alpha subcomplex assembly factor 5